MPGKGPLWAARGYEVECENEAEAQKGKSD